MPNHYAVLNVASDADRTQIRAAFRELARRNHPDVGGNAERMQAIIEAWAVLGRADRRAAYDLELAMQHGRTRRHPQTATASRQSTGTATADRGGSPGDARTPRDPNRVDFGRYAGWTIDALVHHDPEYLEWLARSQAGRVWRGAINVALAERAERMAPLLTPLKRRRRRFGR